MVRKIKSPLLEKIRKKTPLETRIRVMFQMEWLVLNIVPDRQATDEEIQNACAWASQMTKRVLREVKEWEKDGSPQQK